MCAVCTAYLKVCIMPKKRHKKRKSQSVVTNNQSKISNNTVKDRRKRKQKKTMSQSNVRKKHVEPRKKDGFAVGFILYLLSLFVMILIGWTILWLRMDVYEKSRPGKEIEKFIAATSNEYWQNFLIEKGMSKTYIETLDLEDVSFAKRLDLYTEEMPVYSVRFGNVEVLLVSLTEGTELPFGYSEWEIGDIQLTKGKLYIYAPEHAVIYVHGNQVSQDCLMQKNAQALSLGLFDANRAENIGLAKYCLDMVYDIEGVIVKDENGNELPVFHTNGSSYYYAPIMSNYNITTPKDCVVAVNGIVLTQENAKIEAQTNEDFEGIENFVSVVPEQMTYTVEGLVLPPEVTVETSQGNFLEPVIEGTNYWYGSSSSEISDELAQYVLTVFDAYIAYSGNRNDNLTANYNRYSSYLVPGSEAASRAYQAQSSLQWAANRDTRLEAANIKEYRPYSEELFTCQINFTMVGDSVENGNAYLFVFVKYQGSWKVVRVLNKTSFLPQ